MMRVCHISTVHSAKDHRLLNKECVSLAKAGYEVHLIARAKSDTVVKGVHVHGFPDYTSRILRSTFGVMKIGYRAFKLRPEIVHFHDPEILWISPFLRLLGIKLIYDSHEHFPKQVTSKPWLRPALFRTFLSKIVALYEHFFILFVNRVISVTPEIVNRFPVKKRAMIRNFPILFSAKSDTQSTRVLNPQSLPVAIYVGGLTRIRGIKELVDVFARLENKCELRLFGFWESEDFKELCMNSATSNVFYLGAKPNEEIAQEVLKADIGLALLYPVKNYLMSYPVKAFEYMGAALPIIMSDFPYWEKLFKECAVFVNPMDKDEIYSAIIDLIENKDLCKKMGANGLKMVEDEYNWESEAENLVKMYEGMS